MAIYTDGKTLAAATRARAARLRKSLPVIVMAQANAGKATSRGLTHGPQRGANPPSPVSPKLAIGRRTGKLFASWRVRRVASGVAGTSVVVLYNRAAHHQFVLRPGGTRRMSDRGYWEAHRKASAPSRQSIARKGLHQALKG
jgi:hypothetical protein